MNYTEANYNIIKSGLLDSAKNLGVSDELQWLLASEQRKTIKKVKLDDPFKKASLFLPKKPDVRFYLNYIWADGEQLHAANGHTLIVINHRCESGFYNALGEKVKLDAVYPKYAKLANVKKIESFDSLDLSHIDYVSKKVTVYKIGASFFDTRYVKVALSLKPTQFDLHETYLKCIGDGFVALIMMVNA